MQQIAGWSIARWHQPISRRTYSVAGPNSLWHIDGHHNLVCWRLVVHGCIDGFSRLITYLQCATNNTSQTAFDLFWKATRQFGIPSRVRSNKGNENYKVCYYMIATQGTGRGSHVAGSSTHNHRHIISELKGYGEMYIDVYAQQFTLCFTPLKQSAFLIQAMKLMYLFCTVCSYQKSNVRWMDFWMSVIITLSWLKETWVQ